MAKEPIVSTLLLKIKDVGFDTMAKAGSLIASVGKLSVAAFSVTTAAVTYSLKTYQRSEESLNSLNLSLIRNGIYSAELSKQYRDMASSFDHVSVFSKSSLVNAEAATQRYLGQHKITTKLMAAIVDFAGSQRMDVVTAGEMVGRSIGTAHNMLARSGIKLDENASVAEKTDAVIEQLNAKSAGQAAAQLQGLGSLDKLGQAFNRVASLFGSVIAPLVISWAKSATHFLEELRSDQVFLESLNVWVRSRAKSAITMGTLVSGASEAISRVLTMTLGSAGFLMQGKIKESFDTLAMGMIGISDLAIEKITERQTKIEIMDSLFTDAKKESEREELRRVRRSAEQSIRLDADEAWTADELFTIINKTEIEDLRVEAALKDDANLKQISLKIKRETDKTRQLDLQLQKNKIIQDEHDRQQYLQATKMQKVELFLISEKMNQFVDVIDTLTKLQNSKYKEQIEIGKTAAIIMIEINTARAAAVAMTWCSQTIPVIGEAIGAGVAALIVAFGYEQILKVRGIDMYSTIDGSSGESWFVRIRNLITAPLTDPETAAKILLTVGASAFSRMQEFYNDPNNRPGTDPFAAPPVYREPNGTGEDYGTGGQPFNWVAPIIGGVIKTIGGFFGLSKEDERSDVELTINGGLVPSQSEAERIALIIHKEVRASRIA